MPYGDTGSFAYNTNHPDIYEWVKANRQCFDLSDYTRVDMQRYEIKKKNKHKVSKMNLTVV